MYAWSQPSFTTSTTDARLSAATSPSAACPPLSIPLAQCRRWHCHLSPVTVTNHKEARTSERAGFIVLLRVVLSSILHLCTLACFSRSDAKLLLEDGREVRNVLEAHIKVGVRYAASALQQLKSCAQAAICQPAFWRQVAHLFEVAFESRETSTRSLRKLCHGHIAPEILLHEFLQVNFPRRSSILKRVKHKLSFLSM